MDLNFSAQSGLIASLIVAVNPFIVDALKKYIFGKSSMLNKLYPHIMGAALTLASGLLPAQYIVADSPIASLLVGGLVLGGTSRIARDAVKAVRGVPKSQ